MLSRRWIDAAREEVNWLRSEALFAVNLGVKKQLCKGFCCTSGLSRGKILLKEASMELFPQEQKLNISDKKGK